VGVMKLRSKSRRRRGRVKTIKLERSVRAEMNEDFPWEEFIEFAYPELGNDDCELQDERGMVPVGPLSANFSRVQGEPAPCKQSQPKLLRR
jgi:hypothetical protein